MPEYFVYILASRSRTLYIGVTGHIHRRVDEHRRGVGSEFTARYRCDRLVYVESTRDVNAALTREKQLKSWRREKKIALIESMNPAWEDLAAGWGGVES
jgi:putative endonuclease